MHALLRSAGYSLFVLSASCGVGAAQSPDAGFSASPDEARAIARETYLHGFPVVEIHNPPYTQAMESNGQWHMSRLTPVAPTQH